MIQLIWASNDMFADLWNAWNIRAFVLVSLLIQCVLVLFASERKRMREGCLVTLIFCFHSITDFVAIYTIGLISTRQGVSESCDSFVMNDNLLAFWAPFILLHLGGPDNATSLSAGTDDRWSRKSFQLISNSMATIVICIRALHNNPLYLASWMVFLAGTLKYAERVGSLYLASSESWKSAAATRVMPHVGPDYEKLSMAQLAIREAKLPTKVESEQLPPKKFKPYSPIPWWNMELDFDTVDSQLDGKSLLQFALFFYMNFKGFFVKGLTYSHEQRLFTRDFFLKRSSHDAFKLAEMELSFLYEDIHTKATVIRIPALRIVTLALITAASHSFYLCDKKAMSNMDIKISYVLLFGALVLEIVSLLMLIFSGRNVIALNYYNCFLGKINLIKPIANAILSRRKWSKSFSKCNLIRFYLVYRTPPIKRLRATILETGVARLAYRALTSDIVGESLKETIFTELCKRSKLAQDVETATKICSQRGDWVLIQRSCYTQLKWSLGDVEYGRSLLLWHIATDLCYGNDDCVNPALSNERRRFCKEISEYLVYLLLAKPTMIAPVAGNWVKVFWDTLLEAKKLFRKRSIRNHKQACQAILSADTVFTPFWWKGDASASVLFDACRLAKQLEEFKQDNRWSLMSEVWIELLAYAAFHCEETVHAQQPSRGGELLTFVWLVMNHLGLGKQFRKESARTGYRVVVEK
ncbi:hypothetical protein C3L33_08813, partial [Rhododendron williamsianum]